MTTDDREVLSALLDREPVDPVALDRALEDPEARRTLVAFAVLRRELHAPVPGEASAGETPAAPAVRVTRPRPGWRGLAAAALVAAALGGGVALERYRAREHPPEPTRTVGLDFVPLDPGRR
jgi:hypothetical protein